MLMTENTNLNGVLEVTNSDTTKKSVVVISSNLVENSNNFNFSFTITDRTLVTANAADIQIQMNDFITALKAKMTELGYPITI